MQIRNHSPFRRRPGRSADGRCTGDRGASAVEAAFVTPVFLFVIFGIMEIGMLFRTQMTLSAATEEAARAASIHGDRPDTDYQVLQAATARLNLSGNATVNHIIIFQAVDKNSVPDAGCVAAGTCNSYVISDALLPADQFGCIPDGANDNPWCPTSRDVTLSGAQLIGIEIEVQHNYLLGVLGSQATLSERSILRMEPREW